GGGVGGGVWGGGRRWGVVSPRGPPAAFGGPRRPQQWCARNALPLSVQGSAALQRILEDNLRQPDAAQP
ncbi:hypothetical protein, partial [Streptomyces lavendulae]|uniref:hypothetical protein n=1 Tax=Streptomyces lavendulae TaxID=1914 RepID=UPI00369860AA